MNDFSQHSEGVAILEQIVLSVMDSLNGNPDD
jgi:hypothetical protein